MEEEVHRGVSGLESLLLQRFFIPSVQCTPFRGRRGLGPLLVMTLSMPPFLRGAQSPSLLLS